MVYEEDEFFVEDERRYIVLVIYDISENRRRAHMGCVCKSPLLRVF
mgnify:CR=1 FL=1